MKKCADGFGLGPYDGNERLVVGITGASLLPRCRCHPAADPAFDPQTAAFSIPTADTSGV